MNEKLELWCKDRFRISIIFNIVLFLNLFVLSFMYMHSTEKINELNQTIAEYDVAKAEEITILENTIKVRDTRIEEKNNQINALKDKNNELRIVYSNQEELIEGLTSENAHLIDELDSIMTYTEDMETRLSKYEYYNIFMWDGGERTDCNYEILEFIRDTIKDNPVNEVSFYCAWIMVESRWHTDAKSKLSTATGLPQFLESSGKYVYEKLMDNGIDTYDHELMATDPQYSIPMMVTYVEYLVARNGGDLYKAIDNYRGGHSDDYIKKIDNYLNICGSSLDSIAEITKKRFDAIYNVKG